MSATSTNPRFLEWTGVHGHTRLSVLIANGASVVFVSRQLGHSVRSIAEARG